MDRWLDILKDESSRIPNAPVHHYTDFLEVEGIMSSNFPWATATQFSNDLSEIEYGAAIAPELIRGRCRGEKRKISLGRNG
jgi:hypothetical protein